MCMSLAVSVEAVEEAGICQCSPYAIVSVQTSPSSFCSAWCLHESHSDLIMRKINLPNLRSWGAVISRLPQVGPERCRFSPLAPPSPSSEEGPWAPGPPTVKQPHFGASSLQALSGHIFHSTEPVITHASNLPSPNVWKYLW